jgi:hypothetical protein
MRCNSKNQEREVSTISWIIGFKTCVSPISFNGCRMSTESCCEWSSTPVLLPPHNLISGKVLPLMCGVSKSWPDLSHRMPPPRDTFVASRARLSLPRAVNAIALVQLPEHEQVVKNTDRQSPPFSLALQRASFHCPFLTVDRHSALWWFRVRREVELVKLPDVAGHSRSEPSLHYVMHEIDGLVERHARHQHLSLLQ